MTIETAMLFFYLGVAFWALVFAALLWGFAPIIKSIAVVFAIAFPFIMNALCPNKPTVTYSYGVGRGYWATLHFHEYPFGAARMDRGPYLFEWQARNAFPIQRWTRGD